MGEVTEIKLIPDDLLSAVYAGSKQLRAGLYFLSNIALYFLTSSLFFPASRECFHDQQYSSGNFFIGTGGA